MKILLKINGNRGLFLWNDFGIAKLVIGYIPSNYVAGQIFDENTNAWERGVYVHFWNNANDALDNALAELER